MKAQNGVKFDYDDALQLLKWKPLSLKMKNYVEPNLTNRKIKELIEIIFQNFVVGLKNLFQNS